MALTLISNNGARLWVKNPIRLFFNTTGEPSTSSVVVTVEVQGTAIAEVAYPLLSWLVKVHIEDIVKAAFAVAITPPELKYSGSYIDQPQSNDRVRDLAVRYRMSTEEPGSEGVMSGKVIEGGLANMLQIASADINEYTTFDATLFFPKHIRFLTHLPSGRKVDAGLQGWVPWYNYQNLVPVVQYSITYIDGTTSSVSKTFPTRANHTDLFWQIPFGIAQLNLDPSGLGVRKVLIQVRSGGDGEIDLGEYLIHYDYRSKYDWVDIGYQNSLGGWESYRLNGSVVMATDVERKEYEQQVLSTLGANPYYETKMRPKWSCNTGYIAAQEMAALNDLINSKDIRVFFEEEWLPVRCTTKSLTWKDSKDGLYAQTIELETSGSFEVLPRQLMDFFAKPAELR